MQVQENAATRGFATSRPQDGGFAAEMGRRRVAISKAWHCSSNVPGEQRKKDSWPKICFSVGNARASHRSGREKVYPAVQR